MFEHVTPIMASGPMSLRAVARSVRNWSVTFTYVLAVPNTHVILTNMNPFGSNSKSYVDSVIDYQGNVVPRGKKMQLLSNPDEICSLTLLVTVLDNGHTCSG